MMKTTPIPDRRTFKTSDDFLRWLKKRALKQEHADGEQATQSARADRQAAMIWVDDGGRISESTGESKSHLGE